MRLVVQLQPNPPDLNRLIQVTLRFEMEIFRKSETKVCPKDTSFSHVLTLSGTIRAACAVEN